MKKHNIWFLAIIIVIVLFAGTGWVTWEWHETPHFCGHSCHVMDSYYESYTDTEGGMLASKHAEAGVTCLDCHEPDIEEQLHELQVFITGDYIYPLKTRKFENDFCFDCHLSENNHADYDEVKETTLDWEEEYNRNPHDSPHWHNLECYMCHKSHQDSVIYCSECHLMPDLGGGWETPNIPENPIP